MSIENGDFTRASAAEKQHKIVLRFKSMFPSALGRFEMHAARRGGDLSHVDASKTALNSLLIGDADWRKRLEEEIALARAENHAEELEALLRRKRAKERKARVLEGMRDPWQASEGGPLREVILTANRLWFQATDDGNPLRGEDRRAAFERVAVEWLQTRFPGMVVHARGERDELTYHVHAVIAPWVEKITARRGKQRLLVPTAHPLLNNYEAAQTDAGEFFDSIGLVRGERAKEEQREAVKRKRARENRRERIRKGGHEVPDYLREERDPPVPSLRPHVPAPVWWKAERRRLELEALRLDEKKAASDAEAERLAAMEAALRKQEEQVKAREADAIEVVEIVEAIAEERKVKGPLPSGSLGARLIAGLKAIEARMRKQVEARFSEEGTAIGLLHSAVLALREKMRGSLSPEQWTVVEKKTESEREAVSKAADRLDVVRKRREDNAR